MRRIFSLTILSMLLLTVAAIPASEYRLFGNPVHVTSGSLMIGSYHMPTGLPPVDSVPVIADDGSASWGGVSGLGCFWGRNPGTGVLSPATSGDIVQVSGGSTAGSLQGIASGAYYGVSGSTATGAGVYGHASGNGWAGEFVADGTKAAVYGRSTLGNGVEGIAYAESNTLYSIAALDGIEPLACARTYLGYWADLYGAADPANPASGRVRLYAGNGRQDLLARRGGDGIRPGGYGRQHEQLDARRRRGAESDDH